MESRIQSVMMLYGFVLFGGILCVVPWSPVWKEATPILVPRSIVPWVLSGWVRGAVSGLGALDLLIAAQVARELWARLHPRVPHVDEP